MRKSWRDTARPIIAKVLEENTGKDEAVIKKALYDAYPFGKRQYHPYKVWLDEIKVQRKQKRFGERKDLQNPDQSTLFK